MLAFIGIALISAVSVFFRPLPQHPLDAGWGDYPQFLAAVRASTQTGDRIALIIPSRLGSNDYDYAYFRASYFLAGREVLPAQDVRNAQFVAVWHDALPPDRRVVWRAHGGALGAR